MTNIKKKCLFYWKKNLFCQYANNVVYKFIENYMLKLSKKYPVFYSVQPTYIHCLKRISQKVCNCIAFKHTDFEIYIHYRL